MRTPTLKSALLALLVGFVVLGAALLLPDRAEGGEPASCGPQELVLTDTTVSVDSEGCPIDFIVWSGNGTAESVFVLPQTQAGFAGDAVELVTLDLPCGWFQVDVFNAGQFDLGDTFTQEDIDANPNLWTDLLAGDHGFRVCEPTPPEPPKVDVPVVRVPVTSAAVPVIAQPKTAG